MKGIIFLIAFLLLITISTKNTKNKRVSPMTKRFSRHVTANVLPDRKYHENQVENCNDICWDKHSKSICNLGIIPAESPDGDNNLLNCHCISNENKLEETTEVNTHVHGDWCFSVNGCYKSQDGRCIRPNNM